MAYVFPGSSLTGNTQVRLSARYLESVSLILYGLLSAMSFKPEALTAGASFVPQAPEHVMDGGDLHYRRCRFGQVFVVLAQRPVAPLPGEGAFHPPTPRQGHEPPLPFH